MTADGDLERFRLHAEICKVLTDPKRLRLLDALRDGERTVGDLAAVLGIPLPNASQHLGVLRAAGLVDGRREGTSVRYRLAEPAILDACDIVGGIVDRRLQGRLTLATGAPATRNSTAGAAAPAAPAH
jgi:ArsR family transcriptional regulator, virulence genes transcriptional regulator